MSEYTADMIELLTAEPETEPHIVIAKDKTVIVPDELKEINTQFEHNIETVTFDCPRYWDEHDLSTMHIYVNVRRPDKKEIPSLCSAPVVDAADATVIHFDWTLSKDVTYVKGTLDFVAVAKKADENGILQNRWGSRLNRDMEILEGIECETDEIVEESADIIEQILYRLETAAATASASAARAERAETSAIAAAERANSVAASNPNLLDNWYFADPINQRGKTEYSGISIYTIDRWKTYFNTANVAVVDGGVKLTSNTTSGSIAQIIGSVKELKGKTLTVSLLYTGGSGTSIGPQFLCDGAYFAPMSLTRDGGTHLTSVTFKVGTTLSDTSNLIWYINANMAEVTLIAAKLEYGSTQTLAYQDADGNWVLNDPPPDKGMELAKCQRYFQVCNSLGVDTGQYANGVATSDTNGVFFFQLPVKMRATPAITYTGDIYLNRVTKGVNDRIAITSLAISANTADLDRLKVLAKVESGQLTMGEPVILQNALNATSRIYLDANL